MIHRSTAVFVTTLTTACLLSGGSWAMQRKCIAAKNKCMATKAASLLTCEEKAETPGRPPDPDFGGCIDRARTKFDGGTDPARGCFQRLESKPGNDCATFDDTAAAEVRVDSCVDALMAGIDPPPLDQSSCGVGKQRCIARMLKSILVCFQKAATPGKPEDPNFGGCIDKAKARYDGGADPSKGCFVKLESKPGNDCTQPIGNQMDLEAIGDSCIADFTMLLQPPGSLDFTTTAAAGTCGDARDGSNVVLKTLPCGGLDVGGADSVAQESLARDGATNRFGLSCSGPSCTIGATSTTPGVNSTEPDCTAAGCNFGAPLEAPNTAIPSYSFCVLNAYEAPASGTLDLSTGTSAINASLVSDIYMTGNVGQACPRCRAGGSPVAASPSSPATGTCDRGPRTGLPCTSTSSVGLTRDCPTGGADAAHPCMLGLPSIQCIDGQHLALTSINLSPLTTAASYSRPSDGNFCPGQGFGPPGTSGCFGQSSCRAITEAGSAAGPLSIGTAAPVTLASVFCVAASTNGTLNFYEGLPGPGAVSLPGQFVVRY